MFSPTTSPRRNTHLLGPLVGSTSVAHAMPLPNATTRVAKLRIVETDARTSSPQATLYPRSGARPGLSPAWARRYRLALTITDVVVILTAVLSAFGARFLAGESLVSLTSLPFEYVVTTIGIVGTWIIVLGVNHTRDGRIVGLGVDEYRRVVSSSILAFGLLAIALVVLKVDVARGFFILSLPLGLGGLLLGRWVWRHWLIAQRKNGQYQSRTLVVGDLGDVEHVIGQIYKHSASAYQVIGAATDAAHVDAVSINAHTVRIVAGLDAVARAAGQLNADTVIVAGQPAGDGNFIRDLGWELESTGAELVVASRLTNVAGPRIHFRPVEGLPLMHVELPQYDGGKHVMKRALDVCAAGSALLFLLPLLLVIALIIRRDTPGSVLFRQERVGRDGKKFSMLKFRSMIRTAEDDLAGLLDRNEGAGVLFKMKNDPRVTPVGRILRKYSLDEIPQLWNIVKGDMSLVGPRPPLQSEVASYEPHVHRRLYIKPGLTGMWQVNGRSNLDWDESVRLDLYYVENWSLTGDLVIMWRTLKVLRNASGAY